MIRIATRGSDLATWQARWVGDRLDDAVELVIVSTAGDRDLTSPLHEIGGTGLFVNEVQNCVLEGRADLAVHSAKDLPGTGPSGLTIAAYPFRDSPWDSIVGLPLTDIPPGGTIATGSVRRRMQLALRRPDLSFVELRGNMATRLSKASTVDAIVVGTAAFQRLGWQEHIAQTFDLDVMVPQVGQGALAVECRTDDQRTLSSLQHLDRPDIRTAVETERSMLRALGGGCEYPLGAYATVVGSRIEVTGFLGDLDTGRSVRATVCGSAPNELGHELATRLDQQLRSLIEGPT
ncbi:MAG: hydroxymethylbilane synthase [Actinobacteria bacterium]|nr:hydroxymethylbilane synthase [Actinomycetota bacterium]MCB9390411.1 hydroxymethylbilane synthase [Acidimicrobiia bacterium]